MIDATLPPKGRFVTVLQRRNHDAKYKYLVYHVCHNPGIHYCLLLLFIYRANSPFSRQSAVQNLKVMSHLSCHLYHPEQCSQFREEY